MHTNGYIQIGQLSASEAWGIPFMKITFDIFTIIILLGVIHGFFIALVIFRSPNGNHRANRFLALLLCAFSLSIMNIIIINTGLYRYFSHTLMFPLIIMFLFGPLFYSYVRTLTLGECNNKSRDWFHFIPAMAVFIYFLPLIFSDNATKCQYLLKFFLENNGDPIRYDVFSIFVLAQIHLWIYLFLIRRLVIQHTLKVKQFYSSIEEKNLAWINFFIHTFMVVYIIFIGLNILLIRYNYKQISYNILGCSVSIGIFCLGYRGLKQMELFILLDPLNVVQNHPPKLPEENNQPIPNESELSMESVQPILQGLEELMIKEKIFKNSDLSLIDLVKRLSISRSLLSQIINKQTGMSFFDYINYYRIEEIKRLLLDSEKDHLTIVALADEAGFRSKSSFNRIFKKSTGMTPSQFKNEYRKKTNQ